MTTTTKPRTLAEFVAKFDRLALAAMPQAQFARIRDRRVDVAQGA